MNVREIVIEHIYNQLNRSMLGYRVNGNPDQRRFELLNMAKYIYEQLSPDELSFIVKELLYDDNTE